MHVLVLPDSNDIKEFEAKWGIRYYLLYLEDLVKNK